MRLSKWREAGNEGTGVETCRMGLGFCKEITIAVLSAVVLDIRLGARTVGVLLLLHLSLAGDNHWPPPSCRNWQQVGAMGIKAFTTSSATRSWS